MSGDTNDNTKPDAVDADREMDADVSQTPFAQVEPEPAGASPEAVEPPLMKGRRAEDETGANATGMDATGMDADAMDATESDEQTPAEPMEIAEPEPAGHTPPAQGPWPTTPSLLDDAADELDAADWLPDPDNATRPGQGPLAERREGPTLFGMSAALDRATGTLTLRLGKAAATLGAAGVAVLAIGTVAFVRLATTLPSTAAADVPPESALVEPAQETDEHGTPVLRLPVVPDRPSRAVGLNYLVLQSFPRHADAVAYQKRMERAGIDCSVERGLPGFTSKSWYSVVGTRGFDLKTDKDDYQRRVRQLEDLGVEPQAYKWRVD